MSRSHEQQWQAGEAFYKTPQIYELAQLLNINKHLANAQYALGEEVIAEAMMEAAKDLNNYRAIDEPFMMDLLGLEASC